MLDKNSECRRRVSSDAASIAALKEFGLRPGHRVSRSPAANGQRADARRVCHIVAAVMRSGKIEGKSRHVFVQEGPGQKRSRPAEHHEKDNQSHWNGNISGSVIRPQQEGHNASDA